MDDMEHTLINPNQYRYFRAEVQDNPYNQKNRTTITSPDKEFVACLQSEGNVLFLDTWYPTQGYLEVYPHIKISSCHHWNSHQIQFPREKYGVQEEIEGQNVAASSVWFSGEVSREIDKRNYEKYYHAGEVVIQDIEDFNRRLTASVRVTKESALRTGIQQRKLKL